MSVLPPQPEFSYKTRRDTLSALQKADAPICFDALVVGGGIVGAGLARELAIRGIQTLVVEKNDYAFGTSSRSSKLIHGGLRYLEMFDFQLVFEALAERHWLLKTHPHLVHPLEFNLPVYARTDAPPGSRSSTLLGLGLWLYDALSLFRTPFFHGTHSVEQMQRLFPKLKTKGLQGGQYYADAMMLDDELVLESIYDAFRRGASALSYVKATRIEKQGDGYLVELEDSLQKSKPFQVRAKEVISCVGPWTEEFGKAVGQSSEKKLKPSKGIHFIIPWKRLPIESCIVMNSPDKRIIFAIPRKDLGFGAEVVIIGTTDAAAPGIDLDDVHADRQSIDYLLEIVTKYFPDAQLTVNDIAMTYAGVRPLLDSGANSEAKTSREHEICRNKDGVVFMAGGKYTTFRKISQEIADFTFPKTKSSSRNEESKALLSSPEEYAEMAAGKKLWGKFTEEYLRWKLQNHAPTSLVDVLFRRMPLWMMGSHIPEAALTRAIEICTEHFGWSKSEADQQKQAFLAEVAKALECVR